MATGAAAWLAGAGGDEAGTGARGAVVTVGGGGVVLPSVILAILLCGMVMVACMPSLFTRI